MTSNTVYNLDAFIKENSEVEGTPPCEILVNGGSLIFTPFNKMPLSKASKLIEAYEYFSSRPATEFSIEDVTGFVRVWLGDEQAELFNKQDLSLEQFEGIVALLGKHFEDDINRAGGSGN